MGEFFKCCECGCDAKYAFQTSKRPWKEGETLEVDRAGFACENDLEGCCGRSFGKGIGDSIINFRTGEFYTDIKSARDKVPNHYIDLGELDYFGDRLIF
ncbi:hypothetical protein HNV12_03345 [Methanococcoides sp. SA1]|nr:hypothetical protein [Methanococcoides sp. SA1]